MVFLVQENVFVPALLTEDNMIDDSITQYIQEQKTNNDNGKGKMLNYLRRCHERRKRS